MMLIMGQKQASQWAKVPLKYKKRSVALHTSDCHMGAHSLSPRKFYGPIQLVHKTEEIKVKFRIWQPTDFSFNRE